jgi:TetR/AcrR family tetracycline transcriptional repressor
MDAGSPAPGFYLISLNGGNLTLLNSERGLGRAELMGAAAKLDQAAVVTAAFEVLSDVGLDGLSLRRVAGRLGVQAPALYWHVRDKAELISLMAATLAQIARREDHGGSNWRETLMQSARAWRRAMLKLRDSARVCVAAQAAAELMPQAPLTAAGLTSHRGPSYQAAVRAYTFGWVAFEQSWVTRPIPTQPIDFDASFETGLEAMVNGFT